MSYFGGQSHGVCVAVRGQLAYISSLLLSDHSDGTRSPSSAENTFTHCPTMVGVENHCSKGLFPKGSTHSHFPTPRSRPCDLISKPGLCCPQWEVRSTHCDPESTNECPYRREVLTPRTQLQASRKFSPLPSFQP